MSANTYSRSIRCIHHVESFPAIDHTGGNSKIPSIVIYDLEGVPRAFGGEALQESMIVRAKCEDWVKMEW